MFTDVPVMWHLRQYCKMANHLQFNIHKNVSISALVMRNLSALWLACDYHYVLVNVSVHLKYRDGYSVRELHFITSYSA